MIAQITMWRSFVKCNHDFYGKINFFREINVLLKSWFHKKKFCVIGFCFTFPHYANWELLNNYDFTEKVISRLFFSFFRFCGPKLSLFFFVLSIWGIIQLSLMSLALYSKNVTFIDDFDKLLNETDSVKDYGDQMDEVYEKGGFNCMIAAILYAVTFVIAGHQYWLNTRSSTQNRYQRHY